MIRNTVTVTIGRHCFVYRQKQLVPVLEVMWNGAPAQVQKVRVAITIGVDWYEVGIQFRKRVLGPRKKAVAIIQIEIGDRIYAVLPILLSHYLRLAVEIYVS